MQKEEALTAHPFAEIAMKAVAEGLNYHAFADYPGGHWYSELTKAVGPFPRWMLQDARNEVENNSSPSEDSEADTCPSCGDAPEKRNYCTDTWHDTQDSEGATHEASKREGITIPQRAKFSQLVALSKADKEALVFLGCGGKPVEWVEGITKELIESHIMEPGNDFPEAYVTSTTGGRTDIVMVFPEKGLNVGKLAMWRLQWGDCSWLSDYIVNYKEHHTQPPPGDEDASTQTA